jgi:hypothetical protein
MQRQLAADGHWRTSGIERGDNAQEKRTLVF